jgi:hypothetical protein
MALFLQKWDPLQVGVTPYIDESQGQADLILIGGDSGFGWLPVSSERSQVTYNGFADTPPKLLLLHLANLPLGQDVLVVAARSNFVLFDGTTITGLGAVTLPAFTPPNNNSADCLVIYDISQNAGGGYCGARLVTGATEWNLRIRPEHYLVNHLDYASGFVTNTALPSTPGIFFPTSAADRHAIDVENDLRYQICALTPQDTPEQRDPNDASVVSCSGINDYDPCKCCIIASVASGSAVSPEVNALRAVRDTFVRKTEVGFAFFNKLLYDYYAFSPQICTTMAGRPELAPMVLQGFVRPLIVALRLLQAYAFEGANDAGLGRLLAEYHPDQASAVASLALLNQARAFSEGSAADADELAQGVARLLRERAWTSAHVRWGLIEPVRIYGEALQAHAEGTRASDVGRLLRRAFTAWAAEMPLDHVWAGLTAKQARDELAIYESRLLRSAPARKRFRRRLADRFGDITAVKAALAGAAAVSGSAA